MKQISANPQQRARAVLWDLDGTLVDSLDDHWETWRTILAPMGYSLTRDRMASLIGTRNDRFLAIICGDALTDDDVARMSFAKEEGYRDIVRRRGVRLLPGATHCLEILRDAGWHQLIASSAPWDNIRTVLECSPLGDLVEGFVSADEVPHGKPDPAIFLAAASRIGVPADRCIVVEDAHVGIEAATRAGMRAIGVLTTHSSLEADLVVERLDSLSVDDFDLLLDGTLSRTGS